MVLTPLGFRMVSVCEWRRKRTREVVLVVVGLSDVVGANQPAFLTRVGVELERAARAEVGQSKHAEHLHDGGGACGIVVGPRGVVDVGRRRVFMPANDDNLVANGGVAADDAGDGGLLRDAGVGKQLVLDVERTVAAKPLHFLENPLRR